MVIRHCKKISSYPNGYNELSITLVNWLKASLLAAIEANTELNLGDCALSEVTNTATS